MSKIICFGVDPGLVHTGVVRIELWPDDRVWSISAEAVDGVDVQKIKQLTAGGVVYVEDYRARQSYSTDVEMIRAVGVLQSSIPNVALVNNMGSRKTLRRKLLELLGLLKFPTTHHQDLQAAARILVWGMLKEEPHNQVLAQLVKDEIRGTPWTRKDKSWKNV